MKVSLLNKSETALALLMTVFAATMHFSVLFHAGPLWRDEILTLNLASMPSLSDMWRIIEFESFPILWLLVLRSWLALGFGDVDSALRIVGMFVGLGTIALLWWTANKLSGNVPLISLALFALNPTVPAVGDSLRAYGFGVLLMLLMLGSFWRLVDRSNQESRSSVVLAASGALLAVQALYYNSILLFAICGGSLAVSLRRKSLKLALIVMGIGVICALSLLPYIDPINRRLGSWNSVIKAPVHLIWLGYKFFLSVSPAGAHAIWVWAFLLIISIHYIVRQLLSPESKLSSREKDLALFLMVSLGIGCGVYVTFLLRLSYLTESWYYLPLMGLLAVFFDAVTNLMVKSQVSLRVGRLAVVLLFLLLTATGASHFGQVRQTNVDLVAARVKALSAPEDLVIVNPWWLGISFNRYYHGEASWATLPAVHDHRVHRYDIIKKKMNDLDPIEPDLARIVHTLHSGRKVWVAGFLPEVSEEDLKTNLPFLSAEGSNRLEGAFIGFCSRQLAATLKKHRAVPTRLPVECPQPVNENEKIDLYVAEPVAGNDSPAETLR
jgi:hypothetical protein